MKCDLQSCTVNCVFFFFCGLFFDFVLGVLSSSIWVLYQGRSFLATTERKNITNLSCFKRAHYKVFVFLCFVPWGMQTYQRARNVCRLNSQISQTALLFITRFFVLNIPLFTLLTFSYRNFFPLFVCFEILWQLATTHATGTQIVHAKMTSLDAIFCRGNRSSSHALVRFCCRKHKNLPLALRAREKIWARLVGKSSTTT